MGGEPPPKMTAFVIVELETSSHGVQFVSLQHVMTHYSQMLLHKRPIFFLLESKLNFLCPS